MNVDIYINYKGTCEDAFRFYEQHIGGKVVFLMRHGEQPGGVPNTPPDWKNKVLHARLEIGGAALLGADIPNAEPMRSTYVSLSVDSDAEAERIYGLLAEGGEVFMKLAETFFASRFAMLRDRFGTSWMIMRRREQG